MERLNNIEKQAIQILALEEYYSIEDYGSFLVIFQTSLQNSTSFGFFLFNSNKNFKILIAKRVQVKKTTI